MSPERKSKLDDLRKKYGASTITVSPADFGLNQEKIEEIRKFNENIEQQNQEIYRKTEKESGERSRFINLALFILYFPAAAFVIWISYKLGWETVGYITAYILGGVFVTFSEVLKEKVSGKRVLLSMHILSTNLDQYNERVADNILFAELSREEHNDREERLKKDFWFKLGGYEFENQMAKLFEQMGYAANVTKRSRDGGIDINLFEKDGVKTIVQCKAHKKPVGPHEARAINGLMSDAKAQKAILVNLGGFTQGTRDFTRQKNIQLMDIKDILRIQKELSPI